MRRDPAHRTRFHRHLDCFQLTKGPARGDGHEIIGMDLNDVEVRPCLTCYPDAPRVKIRHPYCYTCESPRACEHNGGVQVNEPGFSWWVWPDSNLMPVYRKLA